MLIFLGVTMDSPKLLIHLVGVIDTFLLWSSSDDPDAWLPARAWTKDTRQSANKFESACCQSEEAVFRKHSDREAVADKAAAMKNTAVESRSKNYICPTTSSESS
mgnify:CR=1 FL=1